MMNRATLIVVVGMLASGLVSQTSAQLVFRQAGPELGAAHAAAASQVVPAQALDVAPAEVPAPGGELRTDAPTGPTTTPDSPAVLPQPLSSTSLPSTPLSPPASGHEMLDGVPLADSLGDLAPFESTYQEANSYLTQDPVGVQEIYSTGSMYMNGQWYVQQDVVEFIRTGITDRAVARAYEPVSANASIASVRSLNINAVPLRYQPGMRITLGRILGVDHANRQHAIELGFLGLFDWDNQFTMRNVFTDNDLVTVLSGDPYTTDARLNQTDAGTVTNSTLGLKFIAVPGFTFASEQTLSYSADLNNYELNYRLLGRPGRDRMALQPDGAWVRAASSSNIKSVFAGLRLTTLNELLVYTSRTEDDARRGFYETRLNNRLLGLQIGGQVVERHHNWLFGLRAKTGGLVNFARRNSLYDGFDDLIANNRRRLQEELHDEHLAFLGEAGVFTSYEFSGRSSLRIGYDVLYLTGVAAASPNLSLGQNFGPMNIESGALFHGASVGYELVW